MADAAAPASPPAPAMLPPSDSTPLPPPADAPTPAAATPSLPDTPASADPETPYSDSATAADASDADASATAMAFADVALDDAPGDGEDDGINHPASAGSRKHMTLTLAAPPSKKSKKKGGNCVWTRPTSRKGKKKGKQQPGQAPAGIFSTSGKPRPSCGEDDELVLTPATRLAADRNDDGPDQPVLLSRVHKSEKIEVSEDRLTCGSTKGYRMIRATRGVACGAWYFEVTVVHLGPSGATRLGWATNMADLQTPVGCDDFGFAYRNLDGAKVTKAWRDDYGDGGYGDGDVLGFYISLPQGEQYEPKQPDLVKYKGMPFHAQVTKDGKKTADPVPGSEVVYFKNGVCQGTAFVNIPGGRYYPAASMYTLPDEPNCEVRFNFGPDFVFFPEDFGGRPVPRPMSEVPYQAHELKNEGPTENGTVEKAGPKKKKAKWQVEGRGKWQVTGARIIKVEELQLNNARGGQKEIPMEMPVVTNDPEHITTEGVVGEVKNELQLNNSGEGQSTRPIKMTHIKYEQEHITIEEVVGGVKKDEST